MISDTPPRNLRRLVARLKLLHFRKGYRGRIDYMATLTRDEQVWVSKWVAGWRPDS